MRALTHPRGSLAVAVPLLAAAACSAGQLPAREVAPAASEARGAPVTSPSSRTAAAQPTAAVPPSPSVEPAGSLGVPGPVAVAAVSRSGLFGVLCQPRMDTNGDGRVEVTLGPRGEPLGDALALWLVFGAGEGEAIDEVLATDPGGRFLVVRRGERTHLIDAQARTELDLGALGADLVDDALPHPDHRALAFDASGSYLGYLQHEHEHVAVLRELATGNEKRFELGAGRPWRLRMDPAGGLLTVAIVVEDRDGNGKLDWPAGLATGPRMPCRLPVPRRAAHEPRLDGVTFAVVPTRGGAVRRVAGLVTPLGERLIVREPGGRLVLEDAHGRREELVPARCEGRVQHADSERGLALVSCKRTGKRPVLRLVGERVDVDLGLEGQPRTDAWATGAPTRLVPVYPGQEAALVDLDARSVHRLAPRDVVLGTYGSRALVLRSERLIIEDVVAKSSLELGVTGVRMPEVLQAGALVLATPHLIDLERQRLAGRLEQRALALLPSGRALVAIGSDADASALAQGPLSWVEPLPPETSLSAGSL